MSRVLPTYDLSSTETVDTFILLVFKLSRQDCQCLYWCLIHSWEGYTACMYACVSVHQNK